MRVPSITKLCLWLQCKGDFLRCWLGKSVFAYKWRMFLTESDYIHEEKRSCKRPVAGVVVPVFNRLSFAVPENHQKNLPKNQEHRFLECKILCFPLTPPFRFKSYVYQLLAKCSYPRQGSLLHLALYVLSKPGDDKCAKMLFNDVDTSYLSVHANRHNVKFWGSDNPHAVTEGISDGLFIQTKVLGLYFGGDGRRGRMYQNMLNKLVPPILEEAGSNNLEVCHSRYVYTRTTINLIMYYTYSQSQHNSLCNKPLHWVQLHVSTSSIGHHQVVPRLIEQLYNTQGTRG